MKSHTFEVDVLAPGRHQFVDLTDELMAGLRDAGIGEGCLVAFCTHTTCALMINEWEDGAMNDVAERLRALVPDDIYYAHDDMTRRTQNFNDEAEERRNGPAHVSQMLVGGTSLTIPISHGEPAFGKWQRLVLWELDEPKDRKILFHIFGE
ncbi:MAG TPA: secondary thiamine-phosphate synthase enzyme YjbQ [Actinomycetota bacterium]|jgi:secondary thiamine-phosphate synthase enzyme|nr:secondary thiamine-phosphate synthase enzyme YjbQ [Actinomycetota bacterium]